nr:Inner membrane transport permease ybhR [Klebsiella pneumoniae]
MTNATIAIYNEDSGRHAVELTQRFARAKAFTHVLLLQSPQAIQPTIDEQKLCWWCASRPISRAIWITIKPPRCSFCSTDATPTARKSPPTICNRL